MRAAMAEIDFEAEGLLEGLEGDVRKSRLRLLTELADDGVPLDELRTAVAEDRLALLPVERVLGGGEERLTAAEVAERAGIDEEFLRRQWRALGMAATDDAAMYSELDVEAAKRVRELRDGGLPDDGVLEVGRLLGMTMSQLAAASRRLVADTFMHEGDTEYEVASRFADAARAFMPLIADSLPYVFAIHLREQIRHDAFGQAELSSGRAAERDDVTVCFVDMVDFTHLGRRSTRGAGLGDRAARRARRGGNRAAGAPGEAARRCGDVRRAGAQAGGGGRARSWSRRPRTRATTSRCCAPGSPAGRRSPRGGDWYGRPVNLASRITAIARPDSVLTDSAVHDALEDSYDWSFAGPRRLKGIDGRSSSGAAGAAATDRTDLRAGIRWWRPPGLE